MVKRDRILKEADKLAAKGKLEGAIREYQRALDQSPNDTTTLNRLGDLLVRVNRIDEAIDVYQRIAAHFAEDGFFLKAIAIYKKINRLDPQHTQVYEKLADLYFKQGLVVEGRQQLLTLADWFLRSNTTSEAIRLYRRLTQLEPNNFQIRAKLVDLLIQSGEREQVADDIRALAGALLSRGLIDEAVTLADRALEVGPPATQATADVARALLDAGRNDEAVRLIVAALDGDDADVTLREAAGRILVAAGEAERGRKVLEELVAEHEPTAEQRRLLAEACLATSAGEAARDLVLPHVDALAHGGERTAAVSLMRALVSELPDDVEVLERAARMLDRRQDGELLNTVEASLADAYYDGGKRSEALELYRRLQRGEPANQHYVDRVHELGGEIAGPAEGAAAESGADLADDGGFDVEEVDLDIAFDGVAGGEGDSWHATESDTVQVASAPEAFTPPDETEDTNAEELYTEAVVFAKYGLRDKAISHLHRLLALDPAHANGRSLLASLGGGEVVEVEDEPVTVAAGPEPVAQQEASGDHFTVEIPDLEEETAALPPPGDVRPEPEVRLEELEAILGLGGVPSGQREQSPAADDVEPISFEPIDVEFDGLPADDVGATSFGAGSEPAEEPIELVDAGDVLSGPGEAELRALDALIGEKRRGEAAAALDELRGTFGDHPDLMSRQALLKAQGWDDDVLPGTAEEAASASELFQEEDQFFDLAAELEQELADEELVAEATGAGKAPEASIEELFKEFQRGVAEQLGDEDYDTHFNLGLAYREMELLDEAIGEFQLSAKAPHLFVESASMIGSCLLDKGLADDAASWYAKALEAPELAPEAEVGLRYELGRALETSGNTTSALAHYAEVLALNPAFRDVVDRVERLRSN